MFVGEVPTDWTLLGGVSVITSVTVRAVPELRDRGRTLETRPAKLDQAP